MSNTVESQGRKDGHQEAFEDSPSKERGVCCDGACCTARTQLLNPDDICCGCFKPVHDACCRMIDEDKNRIFAACNTKPKGKSDASSSATQTEQEQDEDDQPDPRRPVLWSATILESPVESPVEPHTATARAARTEWTRAATATAIASPLSTTTIATSTS
jgi:hypothetical protein